MANTPLSRDTQTPKQSVTKTEDVKSQKGTIFSLGIVGAVIVIMWVGVFWIYMSRL